MSGIFDGRVSPKQKELLKRAATLRLLSLSSSVVYHSLEAAREEINPHQRLELSDRDFFLSLVEIHINYGNLTLHGVHQKELINYLSEVAGKGSFAV